MENKFANKPNRGRIWLKRNKINDQPDYSGTIAIDDSEMSFDGSDKSIALWENKTKNGETYFSVRVEPLREIIDEKKEAKVVDLPKEDDFSSDDIPF
jgi:hypothetical protein